MRNTNNPGSDVNVFSSVRNRALRNLVKMNIAALNSRYVPISTEGTTSSWGLFATMFAIMKYPLLLGMLVKIGGSAFTELENALHHPNLNVRLSAMTALGNSGNPRAVDLLLRFLDSGEAAERQWAVAALGLTRSPLVFERMIGALDDNNADVRESAIRALGDFGNASALPKLEQIAETDKTLVESYGLTLGHVAKEAIEKIRKSGER